MACSYVAGPSHAARLANQFYSVWHVDFTTLYNIQLFLNNDKICENLCETDTNINYWEKLPWNKLLYLLSIMYTMLLSEMGQLNEKPFKNLRLQMAEEVCFVCSAIMWTEVGAPSVCVHDFDI